MTEHRYLGKTSKDYFVIKGINVFNERWCGTGNCVTVTSPLDKKNYVFSEYTSDGVKFIAGKTLTDIGCFLQHNLILNRKEIIHNE